MGCGLLLPDRLLRRESPPIRRPGLAAGDIGGAVWELSHNRPFQPAKNQHHQQVARAERAIKPFGVAPAASTGRPAASEPARRLSLAVSRSFTSPCRDHLRSHSRPGMQGEARVQLDRQWTHLSLSEKVICHKQHDKRRRGSCRSLSRRPKPNCRICSRASPAANWWSSPTTGMSRPSWSAWSRRRPAHRRPTSDGHCSKRSTVRPRTGSAPTRPEAPTSFTMTTACPLDRRRQLRPGRHRLGATGRTAVHGGAARLLRNAYFGPLPSRNR